MRNISKAKKPEVKWVQRSSWANAKGKPEQPVLVSTPDGAAHVIFWEEAITTVRLLDGKLRQFPKQKLTLPKMRFLDWILSA